MTQPVYLGCGESLHAPVRAGMEEARAAPARSAEDRRRAAYDWHTCLRIEGYISTEFEISDAPTFLKSGKTRTFRLLLRTSR
jgi:hypothetical protein